MMTRYRNRHLIRLIFLISMLTTTWSCSGFREKGMYNTKTTAAECQPPVPAQPPVSRTEKLSAPSDPAPEQPASEISEAMAREISSQEISPPLPAASAQQSPDTVSDAAASIAPYFRKMGIRLDGTENLRLLQAIAQWMGTPYQWGGCSPYGIDCSCLVKFIYETVYGISLHRTSVTMFENDLTPVPPEELREGDVLSFDTKGSGISHVGIYLKANRFVHASLSRGVMISSLDQSYFKKRFISGGRVVRHPAIRLASLSLGELVIVNP